MSSPGRASNLADVSSAVSTLSSFSSTSSDEQRLRVPARRKLPAKKPPSAKRAKHDTSSDTTSSYTRKTTSSDTSHDTSHDKSHDTSNDRSREDEKDISGSQQDMFGDEREYSSSVGSSCLRTIHISQWQIVFVPDNSELTFSENPEGKDNKGDKSDDVSHSQQPPATEQYQIATPAQKLQSLQFSGHCVSVCETAETETCGYVTS